MKKHLITVLMVVLAISTSFASEIVVSEKVRNDLYNISYQLKPDHVFEEEYYRQVIPAEFCETFLYYTKDFPEIRLNFYSIMVHESGNFKYFKNRNRNGTLDLGPSQLNSANLENPDFVDAFAPKDNYHIYSMNCYYMVLTINYYHDLYKRLGDEFAFYAYNGGDRAARLVRENNKSSRYASLIKAVTTYDASVRALIEKHKAEMAPVVAKLRGEFVNWLCEIYNARFGDDSIGYDIHAAEDFYKFGNDRIAYYYIRRKYLTELKSEEVIVVLNPVVGTCYHEIGEIIIT